MRKLWIAMLVPVLGAGCSALNNRDATGQDVDLEKVGAVERAADRQGVDVLWVNPPRKASRAPR